MGLKGTQAGGSSDGGMQLGSGLGLGVGEMGWGASAEPSEAVLVELVLPRGQAKPSLKFMKILHKIVKAHRT